MELPGSSALDHEKREATNVRFTPGKADIPLTSADVRY
jgi:hypothetical protein